jgi:hypothetical protein
MVVSQQAYATSANNSTHRRDMAMVSLSDVFLCKYQISDHWEENTDFSEFSISDGRCQVQGVLGVMGTCDTKFASAHLRLSVGFGFDSA